MLPCRQYSSEYHGREVLERKRAADEAKEINILENDVLFGRGGNNRKHLGNKRLRSIAQMQKRRYIQSSKKEKSELSRSIVEYFQKLDPPGRFLKKDTNTGKWVVVKEEVAREKVAQAFRDAEEDRSPYSPSDYDHDFLDDAATQLQLPKRQTVSESFMHRANGRFFCEPFEYVFHTGKRSWPESTMYYNERHSSIEHHKFSFAHPGSYNTGRASKRHHSDVPEIYTKGYNEQELNVMPYQPGAPASCQRPAFHSRQRFSPLKLGRFDDNIEPLPLPQRSEEQANSIFRNFSTENYEQRRYGSAVPDSALKSPQILSGTLAQNNIRNSSTLMPSPVSCSNAYRSVATKHNESRLRKTQCTNSRNGPYRGDFYGAYDPPVVSRQLMHRAPLQDLDGQGMQRPKGQAVPAVTPQMCLDYAMKDAGLDINLANSPARQDFELFDSPDLRNDKFF